VRTIRIGRGMDGSHAAAAVPAPHARSATARMTGTLHGSPQASQLSSTRRDGAISGWSTRFDDPIVLPDGRELVTLRHAAIYITSLPKRVSALPEWQAAVESLRLCSRGGDPLMAKIGVMKALHRNVVREFNSDRKETHWGQAVEEEFNSLWYDAVDEQQGE
jgi:hypothetical protein